ncbi:unnamed protein product [Amoebophrya sp. A25]|nr:unnamed protein product [Amoebophrya sp. A25]|eukprot:GSA25T00020322001.1
MPYYMFVSHRSGKAHFVKKTLEAALLVPNAKMVFSLDVANAKAKTSRPSSGKSSSPAPGPLKLAFKIHVLTDRRLEPTFFGRRTPDAILLCLGLASDFTDTTLVDTSVRTNEKLTDRRTNVEQRSTKKSVNKTSGSDFVVDVEQATCSKSSSSCSLNDPTLVDSSAEEQTRSCFGMRSRPKSVRFTSTLELPPLGAAVLDSSRESAGSGETTTGMPRRDPRARRRASGFPRSVMERCRGIENLGRRIGLEYDESSSGSSSDSSVYASTSAISRNAQDDVRVRNARKGSGEQDQSLRVSALPKAIFGLEFPVVEMDRVLFCKIPIIEPIVEGEEEGENQNSFLMAGQELVTWPLTFQGSRCAASRSAANSSAPFLPRSNLEEHTAAITHENGEESGEVVMQLMAFTASRQCQQECSHAAHGV